MEMIYAESDLLLLIAEAERGEWTEEGIFKKRYWVASQDNVLCDFFAGNCVGGKSCRECMTYGLLRFIKDQEYDYIRNILKRIRERDAK